jgi:hypothetical protein
MAIKAASIRLLFLIFALVFLLVVLFSARVLGSRYIALRPGMTLAQIRASFGEPRQRVLIDDDGQVWIYPRSWTWWLGYFRRAKITSVPSWQNVPYPYGSITLYFDSRGGLAAWVVTGEAATVHSSLGDIDGGSLAAYFRRRSE